MHTVSTYLIARLRDCGVRHLFGIPGDYVLPFFDTLVSDVSPVEHVGTCNELNAGYAADGYARLRGFGALATTYGPGAFSAITAIAGAYAESVPMILISGAPATIELSKSRRLHHVVGTDIELSLNLFRPITAGALRLMDAARAPAEIDELLKLSLKTSQPVYLEIPYDVQVAECAPPTTWSYTLPVSDPVTLRALIEEIVALVQHAGSTVLLPGKFVERNQLQNVLLELVEKTGFPTVTGMDGKASYLEHLPECIGCYQGLQSEDAVHSAVAKAGVILALGWEQTEFNTGMYTETLDPERLVQVLHDHVVTPNGTYTGVYIWDLLPALRDALPNTRGHLDSEFPDAFVYSPSSKFVPVANAKITTDRLFQRMAHFLREGDIVTYDTGAFVTGTRMRHPKGSLHLGNGNWGCLGQGFGGTVGLAFANDDPNRRVINLEGDGSFHMTANEVSTLVGHRKNVTIIVLNNEGYTAERLIEPNKETPYNDIQVWNYHKLSSAFGGPESMNGVEVFTEGELEDALAAVGELAGPYIINVHLDKMDAASFNASMSEKMQH